jgi:hypothetical protein
MSDEKVLQAGLHGGNHQLPMYNNIINKTPYLTSANTGQ